MVTRLNTLYDLDQIRPRTSIWRIRVSTKSHSTKNITSLLLEWKEEHQLSISLTQEMSAQV